MRVRCHGCQAVWEMDVARPAGRCDECHILATAPTTKTLVGVPVTTAPADHAILGMRADRVRRTLRQAWTAFLAAIPPDRYPAAFRQGREAYERLSASLDAPRKVSNWVIEGRCLCCGELEQLGFPTCLVCRRALASRGEGATDGRHTVTSSSKKVASVLREADSRWRVGKFSEILSAVERGLAESGTEEPVRARLELLAGHALAASGRFDEARTRWLSIVRDKGDGDEAAFCLAATAWSRGEAEEALHYLTLDEESRWGRILLVAAFRATRRHTEAIERASQVIEDGHADSVRALWISATAEFESGNPRGASIRLTKLIESLSGGSAGSLEKIDPRIPASLPHDVVWLAGATLAALGKNEAATAWLARGAEQAKHDPAFPRELATLALEANRYDEAEALLAETRRRGDEKGAARGRTYLEFFRSHNDPAKLLEAADRLDDGQLHYFAGRVLERRGRHGEALRSYSKAIQTDPLMTSALAAAGILHARLGAADRALHALKQALDRGERSTPVIRTLATLMLDEGRIDEAEPLLAELHEREPDDQTIRRNLAGTRLLLALQQANEENEEEAIELIDSALAIESAEAPAWRPVLAELYFRAASHAIDRRADGWDETALDLLERSRALADTAATRLSAGVVRLMQSASLTGEPRASKGREAEQEISAARSMATDPLFAARADLHRAIALHIAGEQAKADQILAPYLKANIDRLLRLRVRWVQAVSIARQGNPIAGRVLLEASYAECEKVADLEEFLKRVRLQILKLRAAESGARHLELEIRALDPAKRTPAMLLLYGIVLAEQRRFDEAAATLDTAAKDPILRNEAKTIRFLMQMSRVAELLVAQKESDALRLFVRLRPTLPGDTEIDLWLNSLEVEGIPVAALRRGDGKPAVATWGSRLQSWRKAKTQEYWELVRSTAIAAHLTAVSAEKIRDYGTAENYWKVAVNRWIELFGADEFWAAYTRRAHELFSSVGAEVIDEVRDELLDLHLVALVREIIAQMRSRGDHLVAADRFAILEQIERWRLERDPDSAPALRALASCHAQRLIIYADLSMWDEARRWGVLACETDPSDPVHFNNMAETFGAEASIALAKLEAEYSRSGPGPHLQPLACMVVDNLALGLAWNPHHPRLLDLYSDISTKVGYGGPPEHDSRIRLAESLREMVPPGTLERYAESMQANAEPESEPATAPPHSPPPKTDAAAISELARILKAAGLDPEAAYLVIVATHPMIASKPKTQMMSLIMAA